MNLLSQRVARTPGIWPEGVGTWLDIYDTEIVPWYEDEVAQTTNDPAAG